MRKTPTCTESFNMTNHEARLKLHTARMCTEVCWPWKMHSKDHSFLIRSYSGKLSLLPNKDLVYRPTCQNASRYIQTILTKMTQMGYTLINPGMKCKSTDTQQSSAYLS